MVAVRHEKNIELNLLKRHVQNKSFYIFGLVFLMTSCGQTDNKATDSLQTYSTLNSLPTTQYLTNKNFST